MPVSGGGFLRFFGREDYQKAAVSTFLTHLGDGYAGLYECVHSLLFDLTYSHFVICAALKVAASPTSLRKHANSRSLGRNIY